MRFIAGVSFRQIATNSNASYHSLETSLSRRFNHGLTFMGSFTFGKLLDYYSAQNLGQTPQNPFNERLDRARSDEDRSRVFSFSFVYEVPFLRNSRSPLEYVIGGRSISGLVTAATGLPVFITSGQDFTLQFRSEFFNLFNEVNFGQPDRVDVDKTFGQIQTAGDPRIVQFALRYQL